MTSADILAITNPRELFHGLSLSELKSEWRRLASEWHPDTNPGMSSDVLAHITSLYARAQLAYIPKVVNLNHSIGSFSCAYLEARATETGDVHVCGDQVIYGLTAQNLDLFGNALQELSWLQGEKLPPEMAKQFSTYFPQEHEALFKCSADAMSWLQVKHPLPNLCCLRDVLAHVGGKLDPKHVAWITSRLLNFACFLHLNKLTFPGFDLDGVFIQPDTHQVSVLGGWWYARRYGVTVEVLPYELYALYGPGKALERAMKGGPVVTMESIKLLTRALLGHPLHSALLKDASIPAPLLSWLDLKAGGDPVDEYAQWFKVLEASFGSRRFTELKLSQAEVYDPMRA